MFLCACRCVCLCVFLQADTSTFPAPPFCFGKAKPQRTRHTNDPCLELADSRVEELIFPPWIPVMVLNRPPPSLPPPPQKKSISHVNPDILEHFLGCTVPQIPNRGLTTRTRVTDSHFVQNKKKKTKKKKNQKNFKGTFQKEKIKIKTEIQILKIACLFY